MHIDDFDYLLPESRIAQTPVEPRDSARLLVDHRDRIEHTIVRDLTRFLEPGDVMVVNDTRVLPARLHVQRSSGGRVELLLLEALCDDRSRWEAMIRPGGRLKPAEVLLDHDGNSAVVFDGRSRNDDTFEITLHPSEGESVDDLLQRLGEVPLPPYITARLDEPARYQTVYARRAASAAAPTAGLHFTPELLAAIESMGVEILRVELIVGRDTFTPISTDAPVQHRMHSEWYSVPSNVLERCLAAPRVLAVGTTSVRSLESAATTERLEGRTNLFIHQGYEWKVVDRLMTNFHLPRTTLLLMIDAFIGSRWRHLYQEAIEREYRFLSFGDAMLLSR
ncbi:MAG: tRNA preQ1(34) S-adenosylmethionine ribosyltransferase-isomerase QueA [Acidimicrobiales bacterium mtb01]|nr:tRNA preQ1(34) S-adenosylmethionine ribosyltransferase-isomerase QueA [Actinomycetota bacterium]TEX45203.1 MAG: tRNA preQ1(34) S-adenosylmethionine ribosyltransferase-isomerase QueA [Acidimicrobiales bacterium mtb01]